MNYEAFQVFCEKRILTRFLVKVCPRVHVFSFWGARFQSCFTQLCSKVKTAVKTECDTLKLIPFVFFPQFGIQTKAVQAFLSHLPQANWTRFSTKQNKRKCMASRQSFLHAALFASPMFCAWNKGDLVPFDVTKICMYIHAICVHN